MIERLIETYRSRYSNRWLVLIIDICIVGVSFLLTNLIKDEFDVHALDMHKLLIQTAFVLFITLISFQVFQTYRGVVRHTSRKEINNMLVSVFISNAFIFIISIYSKISNHFSFFNIKLSVLIFSFLISLFLLVNLRFLFKYLVDRFEKKSIAAANENKVMIYGAGEMGVITKNTLLMDNLLKYNVVGFIDDDKSKKGLIVEGLKVYTLQKALEIIQQNQSISTVIIAINNLEPRRKSELIQAFLNINIDVKILPNVESWINGKLTTNQIKNVRIEELLQRDTINLDNSIVKSEVFDKVVLVTGAAGSIGSEISRQLMYYQPKKLLFLDNAESPLHDLEYELNETKQDTKFELIIADVSNFARMETIFNQYLPQIVFHAAAYKHVPLMEMNALEAYRVNVLGTKNVAELSVKYNIERFVMVSTDKAVNPTNVMGASKRMAEIYTQSLFNSTLNKSTKFITTRFGNVLGSNGSVIPMFRKQIEKGGPITVTHPEITRFFMTIPEACQLVLEAGSTGKGGEIYVFDMGESIKIVELAKRMIVLSGLRINEDIKIAYSGLRPGEKLYEELLNSKENILETHNPKIMIAKVFPYNFDDVNTGMKSLHIAFTANDEQALVKQMKKMIPEYISQNSIFEQLDSTT